MSLKHLVLVSIVKIATSAPPGTHIGLLEYFFKTYSENVLKKYFYNFNFATTYL